LFFSWTLLAELVERISSHDESRIVTRVVPKLFRRVLLTYDTCVSDSVFRTLLKLKQKILASIFIDTKEPNLPGVEELWCLLNGALSTCTDSLSYRDQRDAFVEFARSERPLLQDLISYVEGLAPVLLSKQIQEPLSVLTYGDRWRCSVQILAHLYLLYATWHLSGHDVYALDDGEQIFDILEKCNIPLSPPQRTVVQAALRADINRDARWSSEALFTLS